MNHQAQTHTAEWLVGRLTARGLTSLIILKHSKERVYVEMRGDVYVYMLPSISVELTPHRIATKVGNLRTSMGREIKGHILLARYADVSAQVVSADGRNLPKRTAVVGKWGGANRLIASQITSAMGQLLLVAGLENSEVRRVARHGKEQRRMETVSAPPEVDVSAQPPSPTWIRSLQAEMVMDAYQLERRLGRGFSAEVWKARVQKRIMGVELNPGATVAMKFYFPFLTQGMETIRIQREFSIAADVQHENLAKVYDLVLSPNRPFSTFMVMEYVDGQPLRKRLEQHGPLSVHETVELARQLFGALRELHSLGAIHRDVKAANIMIASPVLGLNPPAIRIKLVDLGIVAMKQEDRFTNLSAFMGSKHSAPLEQLSGEEIDERADIYGAGSVLFHCLKGTPMYDRVGPEGAIVRQMLRDPEQLKDVPAPEPLVAFINRCIAVQAKDRPESSNACLDDIERIINTPTTQRFPVQGSPVHI